MFPTPDVASRINRNTSFFHLNIRSANNKGNELDALFCDIGHSLDIIMLTEKGYSNDEVIKTPNYTSFFPERQNSAWRRVGTPSKNINFVMKFRQIVPKLRITYSYYR